MSGHAWLHARSLLLQDGQVVVPIADAIAYAEGPREGSILSEWDQGYVQAIRDHGIEAWKAEAAGRDEAGPETRLQCTACGHWPQFRNWPNHILAYPSHRAILGKR